MSLELLEKQTAPREEAQFLSEIRGIPRLSPEEERHVAMACAQGDEEAIKTLVSANLRLVASIAREYAGRGISQLDLIQEGSIGLLTAARKFDHSLDYRFSTYATKWIRAGITGYLNRQGDAIRLPAYTAQRMNRVLSAQRSLTQTLGRTPTAGELAAETGLSEERIRDYLTLDTQICSLDAPVGEEDGSLGAILQDQTAPQPLQELVRRELKNTLNALMEDLTPRQRQVLQLRFGMTDGVCKTHEGIGKILGISKERSRQLEKQGLARLQRLGADLGLEDYLE